MPSPLTDVAALSAALADPDPSRRPVILDVRWDLQRGARPDLYAAGHLPGAAFVDLDTDLAAPAGDGRRGRHPLPDADVFVAAMRARGVTDDRPVVVYDDAANTIAARAWWLLRHHGHRDATVLDGGLSAWTAAGHLTEAGFPDGGATGAPGDFTGAGGPGRMPTLDAGAAAALAADPQGVLLDARQPERFTGATEPIDPRAGHIPGAVNRSTRDNVGHDGRLLEAETLRGAFAELGVSPAARVGVYCGSGVTAAHEVLALECAGVSAALYPGSWSEWSSDPNRPIAAGDR